MYNEPHMSDLEPDHRFKMFAYTSPSTSPKTINYIKQEDLDRMKNVKFPTAELSGDGGYFGADYFRNKAGKYAGNATFSHYLKANEIILYLIKDEEFVARAMKENATWFLPNDIKEMFVF